MSTGEFGLAYLSYFDTVDCGGAGGVPGKGTTWSNTKTPPAQPDVNYLHTRGPQQAPLQ